MSKVMSQTLWAVISISYLSLFCLGLLDNVRGPFFQDVTSDLGLSDVQSSLFFAVTSLCSFFGAQIVGGIDRFVSRLNILRLGLVLSGAGFFVISKAQNVTELVITCAIFGVGFGIINVTQNLLVLDGSGEAMRRRLLSGLHGMYAVASLVAPVLAAVFFRLHLGWREAFQIFAFAPVAAFLVSLFVPSGRAKPKHVEARKPIRAVRIKVFLYGVVLSLYVLGELAVSTRLSMYLRRDLSFTPEMASIYLALFFFALLFGRLFFALAKFHSLKSSAIIQVALFLSMISVGVGLYWHPVGLIVSGLAMAPIFAVYLALLTETFGAYSSYAITHALGYGALYVVALHLGMGFITEAKGIWWAMVLGLVSLFLSFIGVTILRIKDRYQKGAA